MCPLALWAGRHAQHLNRISAELLPNGTTIGSPTLHAHMHAVQKLQPILLVLSADNPTSSIVAFIH